MLWTFLAALIGLGFALLWLLYFVHKGSFRNIEEAKYHLFWIDESSLHDKDDRK